MTDSEKWARWTLGVVALTTAAYFAFVTGFGSQKAATAAFALLALTALPASSRRYFQGRRHDEREREISGKALLAGLRALWIVFVGMVLAVGFAKGWEGSITLPLWMLNQFLYWSMALVLAVEAATTLVLYRRDAHA
jgi:hypothetical protein